MFDEKTFFFPFENTDPNLIDQASLISRLAKLSDAELTALEDDLDFCSFTGVPTPRVLDLLKEEIELDPGWRQLAARRVTPSVPTPY